VAGSAYAAGVSLIPRGQPAGTLLAMAASTITKSK
jgi:hypothetical protein